MMASEKLQETEPCMAPTDLKHLHGNYIYWTNAEPYQKGISKPKH